MTREEAHPFSFKAWGLMAVFAVLCGRPALAQAPWPPIASEDLAMKDCPKQPGAPAVILYREESTDADEGVTTVFRRLKILTAVAIARRSISRSSKASTRSPRSKPVSFRPWAPTGRSTARYSKKRSFSAASSGWPQKRSRSRTSMSDRSSTTAIRSYTADPTCRPSV